MKTENIVVIGGTGKTGSRVVKNLAASGYNVCVVGQKTSPALDWETQKPMAPSWKVWIELISCTIQIWQCQVLEMLSQH